MGMWQGINQGLAAAEEAKLSKEQLELRKKAEERAEETFKLTRFTTRATLAAQLKELYGPGSSGSTGSGTSKSSKIPASENKNNFLILTQRFQIDPEQVSKVYATGGAEAVARAVELATDYSEKFKTGGYAGSEPNVVIGQMLEGALYTDSETLEYDWDKISSEIGVPLDDAMRTMMGSEYTVPGTVSFETPALIEKPTLTDLADVEKRAVSNSLQMAKKENRLLANRKNQLAKIQETRDLTSLEEQEVNWLIERSIQVNSAVKSHKDEVYDPLIVLYGSSMGDLLDYYDQFQDAEQILGPSFFESSQIIQTVPSRAVAFNLMRAGILQPPMTVRSLETGKLIKLEE